MTTFHRRRRIVWMAIAIVSLLPKSPALADNGNKDRDNERGVVVTFTKWATGSVPANPAEAMPRRSLWTGISGGDLGAGYFAAEVLDRKASTTGTITAPIAALHAIYEVQAGVHSFTALIQGGSNTTGLGLLEGVILAGWRTGARVHVEFQRVTTCAGNPAGPCFEGTIRIRRNADDSD
jgi:hypothetical protein